MIQNQVKERVEDKTLWSLLTSLASMRDVAKVMIAQTQPTQTTRSGIHTPTADTRHQTTASWADSSSTPEESSKANASTVKISKVSSSPSLALALKPITNAM